MSGVRRRTQVRSFTRPAKLRRDDAPRPLAPLLSPGPGDNDFLPRRYTYERLLSVNLRHTFFNRSEGKCHALVSQPTGATAELMRDFGLLFLDEGTSFSVLYDYNRREQLLKTMERRTKDGQWTWLSFVLTPDTPYFINFTDLPSDFQPNERNLYFNNHQAHFEGQAPSPADQPRHCAGTASPPVLLNPGDQVTSLDSQRVVQEQVQVILVSDQVDEVVLVDLSGQEVLCKPCSIPTVLLGKVAPYRITCQQVRTLRLLGGPEQRVGRIVYLDLSTIPEGLYTLSQRDAAGLPLQESKLLYTQSYPTPVAFMDLVLARPSPTDTGLYPLCDLSLGAAKARIVPLEMELRFERRLTRWCYFVVPPRGVRYDTLRLLDVGSPTPVTFSGPESVVVAGAGEAYRFIANEDLPLQEAPDFFFELKGTRGQSPFESTLMSNVPVAAPAMVLPREGAPPGLPWNTRPSGVPRASTPVLPERRDYSDIYLNL